MIIKSEVISGRQIGRTLGFPTANLLLNDKLQHLKTGVYSVKVNIEGTPEYHKGLLNIGHRPTFGTSELSAEVHILDFSDDIYTKKLSLEILDYIRPEQTFSNKEDLVSQIKKDSANLKKK
ncbi:hypothetical protein FACS1894153_4400 [Bacteroidia bacterium]|nr:hypothetical protein FACS1894153_4400 [Bacteroidia bacterium]